MAAKYWLKLYYEMLDDPKIGRLSPAMKWRFVECLLVAGENDEDGLLPEVGEMAWRVREDGERYETELNELAKAGLLSKVDGRYLVTNYSTRQAAASGAERVAKYRERQKKQEYYEPETEQKRESNEDVTKGYTDKDIDKDKNRTEDSDSNGDGDLSAVYIAYGNEIGGITPLISDKIADALDEFGMEPVIRAINLAAQKNARHWNYIEGIFKRWRVNGFQEKSNGNGTAPAVAARLIDDTIGGYHV